MLLQTAAFCTASVKSKIEKRGCPQKQEFQHRETVGLSCTEKCILRINTLSIAITPQLCAE